MLDILFCTPSFEHPTNPLASIFFEDQVKVAALIADCKISAISVNMISLKDKNSFKYIISPVIEKETNGILLTIINVISIPKMRYLNLRIQIYLQKYLFKRYIKTHNLPDILHAQQFECGSLALWVKRIYSLPYIITEHTTLFARNLASNFEIKLAAAVYSESSYNIAVSHEFADYLSDKFKINFHYLPNVVNTDFFVPGKKSDQHFTFVTVGGLVERKNHRLLIECFAETYKGNCEYNLLIIGNGPTFSDLNNLVIKLKIQDQIKLLGEMDRKEINLILGNCSCFILVSEYETFGIVIIEAMSCGLPVISTRSKGPESIIVNERLGILCDNNKNSIKEALSKVPKVKYNSEYIRSYVVNNFSENIIASSLEEIYKKVESC